MSDPTPRDRQIAAFLIREESDERLGIARRMCDEEGHVYTSGDDRCIRCGHYVDLDDIPF